MKWNQATIAAAIPRSPSSQISRALAEAVDAIVTIGGDVGDKLRVRRIRCGMMFSSSEGFKKQGHGAAPITRLVVLNGTEA